jgi:hypothetical protein
MTNSILRNCRLLVLVIVFVNAFLPSMVSSHSSVGDCPKLIIECPTEIPESGKTYTVKVRVEGDNSNQELSYNWSVSNSEIIEGQGTSSLKVRISDPGKGVTATVEVNGIKLDCDRVVSCSFAVY